MTLGGNSWNRSTEEINDPQTSDSRHSATNEEKNNTIIAYEEEHPEDAAKIDKFIDAGDNNKLTEDDIRNIKYLIYTAEEPYRSIYIRFLQKYKIGDGDLGGGAYYRPWKHTVNYTYPDSFGDDPRGAYTTFFHECGHGIGDQANETKWLGSDTENYKIYSEALGKKVSLREAIEYDVYYNEGNPHSMTSIANNIIASGKSGSTGNVENVINAMKSGSSGGLGKDDVQLYNAVKNEYQRTTGRDATFEAVTDVYGGVSHNELRNKGYGHSTDYWNDTTNPGKELWAEYFSYNMAGDQKNLDNLREYFPESSKVLDQYAADIGG